MGVLSEPAAAAAAGIPEFVVRGCGRGPGGVYKEQHDLLTGA